MLCEICGKREAVFRVLIEGAEMNVCKSCAKGAKILGRVGTLKESDDGSYEVVHKAWEEEEIVDDYAERIKKARKGLGLSLEELAKSIAVKESYLRHIERGEMVPDEKTARKLEKRLGIVLREKAVVEVVERTEEKKEELSLKDIADIEGEDGG